MLDLKNLPAAVRHEGGVSRRLFLAYAAGLATVPWWAQGSRAADAPAFQSDPFTLGVASGDPDHTGMVLWTRLAPTPLDPDGGMKPAAVDVTWELAEDEGMKKVVQRGKATAAPELGHSVHVELKGLQPDR